MKKVIWIKGLSGACKTTLAKETAYRLRAKNKTFVFLDGDELRTVFGFASYITVNYDSEMKIISLNKNSQGYF